VEEIIIEQGENTPIVTLTAVRLVDLFRTANVDQAGDTFNTFFCMAGHVVNPEKFPFPGSFSEMGLDSPPEELESFFENNTLSADTRAALTLLAKEENAGRSELAELLAFVREKMS
jgi:hypothetical protein